MRPFAVNRTYAPELDARAFRHVAEQIAAAPPNGVLWHAVAPRRAGKTWMLRAMEHRLNDARPGSAVFVDLRRAGCVAPPLAPGASLLLDEPGAEIARDPQGLLLWCRDLHAAGARVMLALTPREWVELAAADTGALAHPRDLVPFEPLSPAEAKKLASRTKQAKALLKLLPAKWQRTPFLLELCFETAEEEPALYRDVPALLRTVLDRCEEERFDYLRWVLDDGLTAAQRAVLCNVARGLPTGPRDEALERSGLLATEGGLCVIADPVLEAHLVPLRIHHLSDVHVGPKAAGRVDVKEKGAHGERLGAAAGAAPVRESYADRVRELAARGQAPHVIVISGDIAEFGDAGQYEEAKEWLGRVAESLADHPRLGPGDPRILLAPGNHDVDWRQASSAAGARARHLPFARAFEGFPRTACARLDEEPETRGLTVARYADLGVEILLLGSSELGGEVEDDPVRRELFALVDRLKKDAMEEADAARATKLRADVSRIDPGLVHHRDLQRVRESVWRQPVLLAVLHHPVSPLPATEVARFSGLINAGEVKDTLFHAGFCLVLHGHVHAWWFGKEQWPPRHEARTMRIAAAPSLGSREIQEPNGFNEIEILRERREGGLAYAITVWRVHREGTGWVKKEAMGPFEPGA
jgi:hypothetical protein